MIWPDIMDQLNNFSCVSGMFDNEGSMGGKVQHKNQELEQQHRNEQQKGSSVIIPRWIPFK